jgi:hypothetical protein
MLRRFASIHVVAGKSEWMQRDVSKEEIVVESGGKESFYGGVLGKLAFGPSIEGIGLRRAFAIGIRGTPWITRGSFISVGSSLAGTAMHC